MEKITDLHMYMLPTRARLGREFLVLSGFTDNPVQVHDLDLVCQKRFFFYSVYCFILHINISDQHQKEWFFLNGKLSRQTWNTWANCIAWAIAYTAYLTTKTEIIDLAVRMHMLLGSIPFGAVGKYSFVNVFMEQLTHSYLAVAACVLLTHGRQTEPIFVCDSLFFLFKEKVGICIIFIDGEFSKGLLRLQ